MAQDPLDPQFWSAEQMAFWEIMSPLTIEILFKGAESGLGMLPPELRLLANWDVFNAQAQAFLRRYRVQWVNGISETTRDQMVTVIEEWIQEGDPLPVLQERLSGLDELNKRRANTIAVTEVTRTYAEGNIMAWQSTGFVGANRWNTAEDERVCPICGPLAGMTAPLNGNGFTTVEGGIGIQGPPAHVNCLPGDALVLPVGGVAGGSKRWYKGDVVRIDTAEYSLPVTPNHPVLTRRGFVPASKLRKGDYVVTYNGFDREAPLVGLDKQHRKAAIEDVFGSLDLAGFRVPTSTPDFHGDGANSEVAVIRPNSQIVNKLNAPLLHHASETDLLGAYFHQGSFNGVSALDKFRLGRGTPTGGLMSGFDLRSPLACGHPAPLDLFGLGAPTGFYTGFEQAATKGGIIDPNLPSQAVLALSGDVSIQEIIEVGNMYFSGHVYNLQTSTGVYAANGIITHNCRCWLTPVVDLSLLEEELVRIGAEA